jgi:hypothetical protein
MEKEAFEKILKTCPPDRAKKGVLLFNGMTTCAVAYQKEPSSAKLRDWQKAEAALEEFVSGIEAAKAEKPSFKNKIAVARYIKDQGVKIGKSKLYKDAESGKLRVQADGSVLLADADLYIRAYGTPRQKAGVNQDIEALQAARLELENRKLEKQIEKMEFDQRVATGEYMLRSDFEMEVATRAAVLDTALRQMVAAKTYEWIMISKGDAGMAREVAAIINVEIDKLLNDYVAVENYHVVFVTDDSGVRALDGPKT